MLDMLIVDPERTRDLRPQALDACGRPHSGLCRCVCSLPMRINSAQWSSTSAKSTPTSLPAAWCRAGS